MNKLKDLLKEFYPEDPTPGDLLRAFRKREGMSEKHLADLVGMTEAAIHLYETGVKQISLEDARDFAWALNIDQSILHEIRRA